MRGWYSRESLTCGLSLKTLCLIGLKVLLAVLGCSGAIHNARPTIHKYLCFSDGYESYVAHVSLTRVDKLDVVSISILQ
jgi:hypothetical protein